MTPLKIFTFDGRTAIYLSLLKRKLLLRFARYKLKKRGIFISKNCTIGSNFTICHPVSIIIGDGVVLGDNVLVYHNVTIGSKHGKYPNIGNNVIIYPHSIIIGDIQIGNNSIIGAGSVVLNDVPNDCIVAGNPARIIKRKSDEIE